jgi:hypothetical protein
MYLKKRDVENMLLGPDRCNGPSRYSEYSTPLTPQAERGFDNIISIRTVCYHNEGSKELNARILILAHMVYL